MRAKAGDPPRTMAQKIFASRPLASGAQVRADQVALVREPHSALDAALAHGLKKATCEVAVAYETTCVTAVSSLAVSSLAGLLAPTGDARRALTSHGVVVARAGAGFPAPLHLERFAGPSRLCVTDEPRLAGLGGVGMLTLVTTATELAAALAGEALDLPAPRSIHVQLTGKMRPFVCARDVALELVRRGLQDVVERTTWDHHAPIVVELGGPSVRLLSVPERAVIAAVAPRVGAAAALFPSDERTEVFLRDQRRSKAHRALAPDAGAPFDDVMQIDLGAVDPLFVDEAGKVRAVREIAGKSVSQIVLGGDTGVTLRDLLAAAALLKAKRVPSHMELLLAPPTRQMLEVLASEGALSDLIATGARLIEPDARIATGELYPVSGPSELGVHTSDITAKHVVSASAETAAYTVATGTLGDPRGFKRPVRVSVPRVLPTDDVLLVRAVTRSKS
jgi:aconitate hydratase